MALPPSTPTPCSVNTTPASIRRNPTLTSTTRLIMPPLRFWCLAVTCSDLPDHGQAISRGSLQQVRGGGPAALLTAEGEAQERLALPPISPGRTSADTYRTARRF